MSFNSNYVSDKKIIYYEVSVLNSEHLFIVICLFNIMRYKMFLFLGDKRKIICSTHLRPINETNYFRLFDKRSIFNQSRIH